jgi:endonuclease G
MKADLTRKATLEKMVRLTEIDGGSLEKAGKEPTTDHDSFIDRQGFDSDFLEGWRIDVPRLLGAAAEDARPLRRGGSGTLLNYEHFSVIMSRQRRLPMLTAVNIDGTDARRVPRLGAWSFDGRLDKDDQLGDALYDSNALDRGHMVRREDPIWGPVSRARIANADTFHFTNSCPQMAGVNQKTWLGLENYVLQHARADGMRVSVFTGPYFADDDLEYRNALVPKAFWKVVAIVTETGRPSATAYKVDQIEELSELEFVFSAYKTFQISISSVIEATNIDFSALQEFDGFSEHEARTNQPLEELIEGPESIRI